MNATELRCLESPSDDCTGVIELRDALGSSGRSFPRCEGHWTARLRRREEITKRYAPTSDVPPVGFDPSYAGERWADEY